jgi:hypothetical protein
LVFENSSIVSNLLLSENLVTLLSKHWRVLDGAGLKLENLKHRYIVLSISSVKLYIKDCKGSQSYDLWI